MVCRLSQSPELPPLSHSGMPGKVVVAVVLYFVEPRERTFPRSRRSSGWRLGQCHIRHSGLTTGALLASVIDLSQLE